jgi:APA family basic amino acid/polyamine antiporter
LELDQPSLERTMSLPLLTLYGLGTMVGAGIYALIGKVTGAAGLWAPAAFLLAAGMASLTALSFCELSARLPRAGGEAIYVKAGFRSSGLATLVGLMVALAACVSAATVARGFAGYVAELVVVAPWLAIVGLIAALGGLAAWGIREAAWAAAVMTVIEVGGLLVVTGAGATSLAELPARLPDLLPPLQAEAWLSVGSASLLCFYAFLGFEDMVNVAEEVEDVQRVLPLAILLTLGCTILIYLALTLVIVLSIDPAELADSEAPLADVYRLLTGRSAVWISVVGVLAMTNGALIQIIKASRVLYGLAIEGHLPKPLARIHPGRRTPIIATTVVTAFVAALALGLPIGRLAEATAVITLATFSLANLALCFLKRREPPPDGVRPVPFAIPVAGFVVSASFLGFEVFHWL